MAETPLVSLTKLKAATGDFTDPSVPSPKDAQYTDAITAASALIRSYTGLKFESAGSIATPRQFEYDGSGYLDIDEASVVSDVSSTAGFSWSTPITLSTDQWSAQPFNRPVKLWLRLPEDTSAYGISPAMGFKYNLDTIGYTESSRPPVITVTAVWGWPEIPEDVQRATIWTALSISDTPRAYTQESIEGYSRTRGGSDSSEAIPERAQVALMPYIIPRL